jgi:hypothetical protein
MTNDPTNVAPRLVLDVAQVHHRLPEQTG